MLKMIEPNSIILGDCLEVMKDIEERTKDMFLSTKPSSMVAVKSDTYYPTTILNFASVSRNQSLHPNQKPIELLEFLIKTYTDENDTILDNAMGCGSTCVATKNTGRKYIGIEKNAKYFEIAQERLK